MGTVDEPAEASLEMRPTADVIFEEVEGGAVLLNLKTGVYFRVNEVGLFIWQGLTNGRGRSAIIRAMAESFRVDEPSAQGDYERFVRELLSQGLVLQRRS